MTGLWVLIVPIVLAVVVYYVSLKLHPWTNCWRCKGSTKHYGLVFSQAFRPCDVCGGTGRQPRFGTRFLKPPK